LAAVVTVWTGLEAAENVFHGGEIRKTMMMHQYFGFAILGLSAVLSLWVLISKANAPQKGRKLFLVLFFMLAGLVLQGADLGGRLVFLHGVGIGKKSETQEATPHELGEHQHSPVSPIGNNSPT
jgi:uncharacterized membrane protein